MSGLFSTLEVSSSAMSAQRHRMNLLITNIANADTTRTPEGGPYRRKDLVFETESRKSFPAIFADLRQEESLQGVRIREIITDDSPSIFKFEPDHPDADEKGMVAYPNVKPLEEMANLMSAIRSFEMNVRAFDAMREIAQKSIELARA